MNISRAFAFAMSVTLMLLGPLAVPATSNCSHPPFSVTNAPALDLRETGSRLVVETIEDALRVGGLALLGEGFQLDSSLNWVSGETIEGEIDVVVPLWSRGGHVVFTQPGMVFWPGIEEQGRADGNFGVVYRTPVGFNAVGGASVFYDHDFLVGHSRISLGADIQRGYLHGSANYYQPLGDEEEGRTGYMESALRGMDARLVYERRRMRVSGNLGYWEYEGIGGGEGDWELSYGLDAGIRIRKGVFVEAGYEKHEDASIEDRFNLGVALKFSLPGFEGASYGDGSRSANLYKIVEREKRILYEEKREIGPPVVSFRAMPEGQTLVEGGTLDALLTLSRPLEENVTLNIVARGTAMHGLPYEWDMVQRVPAGVGDPVLCINPCPVTFAAGQTSAGIQFTASSGTGGKTIDARIEIPAEFEHLVELGDQTRLDLTIAPYPTVSLNYGGETTVEDEADALRMTVRLSRPLDEDVGVTLFSLGSTTTARYGAGESGHDDYYVRYIVVPSDEMPADSFDVLASTACPTITMAHPCHVTIPAGQTTVDVEVLILENGRHGSTAETADEMFNLTVEVFSAGSTGLLHAGTEVTNDVDITIDN